MRGRIGMKKLLVIDKNHQIDYEEFGSGKSLVLLPSLFLSSYSYRPIAQKLGRYFHVIIPNLYRGHSTYLQNAQSFSDYTYELDQFVSKLSLRPFYLIGFSFSTLVALSYGQLYPQNVKKLFLFSGTLFPDKVNHKLWRFFIGYADLLFFNLRSIKGNMVNIRWFADGLQFLFQHPKQLFLDISMAISNASFIHTTIKVPIVLINAERDQFLPKGHVSYHPSEKIYYELVNGYHGWFFNNEEKFVERVRHEVKAL